MCKSPSNAILIIGNTFIQEKYTVKRKKQGNKQTNNPAAVYSGALANCKHPSL